MTNNHCIGNSSSAANTDFQFNYQYSNCTGGGGSYSTISGANFVKTSSYYDYTLVKLPSNPTGTYGYLRLAQSAASVGRRIYIPQHPAGRPKEVSVNTDWGGVNGKSAVDQVNTNGLRYYADTEGGSSGSPVIDYYSHHVIAIHNTGGCPNGSAGRSDRLISSIGSSMPSNGVAPNSFTGSSNNGSLGASNDGYSQAEGLASSSTSLAISPNPVTDLLTVITDNYALGQYRITNVQGQTMQEGQLLGNSIQVSNLNRGVYFITFYNDSEQEVRKLIKQ